MERNETNWIPSPEQIKLADMMVNPEDRRSKRDKFADAGVPITTAYRWFKDKNYVNYIKERLDEIKNSELPDVWKSLIMKCKRGDTQAIKLYFELTGEYQQSVKAEIHSTNTNYNIEAEEEKLFIANATPEELERASREELSLKEYKDIIARRKQ